MIIPKVPRWIRLIERYAKKVGLFLSLGWASYKAIDNRGWALQEAAKVEEKQEAIDSLKEKNKTAERRLNSVLYNIAASVIDYDDLPFPLWYKIYNEKTGGFQMVYINTEYEKRYKVSRIEYLGKMDEVVFDSKIANIYYEGDLKAFNSREPIKLMEQSITGEMDNVIKWRVDKGGNIFIFGMVINELNE